jgi:hypothetical protein
MKPKILQEAKDLVKPEKPKLEVPKKHAWKKRFSKIKDVFSKDMSQKLDKVKTGE